mgnify:CR=1 FL=1
MFERRGTRRRRDAASPTPALVAPGYVSPWAAPGMPAQGAAPSLRRARAGAHRAAGSTARRSAGLWRWWRACRPATYRANRARMQRLAHFSRDRLHAADAAPASRLRARARASSSCCARARRPGAGRAGRARLAELGVAPQLLDAAGCRAIEPGLNPRPPLHAGIYSKDDEVGNCRQFTHLLRKEAERAGASLPLQRRRRARSSPARSRSCVAAAPHDARDEALRARDADASGWSATAARGRRDERAELRCGRRLRRARLARRCCGRSACACRCTPVYGYSVTAPLRHDERICTSSRARR